MDPRAWRRFKKNKGAIGGLILVCIVTVVAFIGPFFAPYEESEQFTNVLILDSGLPAGIGEKAGHLLGGDSIGRDQLTRLLYGGRVSMLIAFIVTAIASVIGLTIGVVSGYFGGRTDFFLMRFVDVLLSLPFLILAITAQAAFMSGADEFEHKSVVILIGLLGALMWLSLARVVRSKTMQVRELEYVQAARALGIGTPRILLRHVLPNILGPAIVIGTTMVANVIIIESAMSYLGVGVKPPTATWGSMIKNGEVYLAHAPHLVVLPGLMIMMAVFGFNMFGEGLRDALDPKDTK